MGYLSGQHGQLSIKPAASGSYANVGRLSNWSISFQQAVLDTTCLTDTDRTIIQGTRSFSGQATLMYYEESNSNIKLMTNQFIDTGDTSYTSKTFGVNSPPQMVRLSLQLNGDAARTIDVFAMVSSFALTVSTGEVVSAEIGFEGSGAPSTFNL